MAETIMERILNGRCGSFAGDVLVLGQGGSGKSWLIKEISKVRKCHVFAPTNQQAALIGGQTVYQFCNVTIKGIENVEAIDTPFEYPFVIIDEVFMVKVCEMRAILRCAELAVELGGQRPRLLMFGDEYQICAQQEGERHFFYEAFENDGRFWVQNGGPHPSHPPAQLEVIRLQGNRRCEDVELQKILDDYRRTGIAPRYINYIRAVDVKGMLQLVLKESFTVLVGTHEAQNRYQAMISRELKKQMPCIGAEVWRGADGQLWRVGQTVFTTSFWGSIQIQKTIVGFEGDCIMVKGCESACAIKACPPRLSGNKYKYDLVSGDVMVVDAVQGRTLAGVILDLQSFFSFGSYYVGISRVKKMSQLRLLTQPRDMIQVDLSNRFITNDFTNDFQK